MDRLLNTKEMQQVLCCGRTKLYELIHSGVLPVTKIGKCYYISEKRLDSWVVNSMERNY